MSFAITIGLPFHDNQFTLRRAIQSVYAQSTADWELLLVDDGSSDDSLSVAQEVADSRVRVISDGANLGLASRLNQIAALARGRFLARMDADDLMHPNRLAAQVRFLEEHSDVQVVGSSCYVIDHNYRPLGMRTLGPVPGSMAKVLARSPLVHPSITGRTDWFRANQYDSRMRRAQDHELWIRTFRHTQFANLDQPLHFYQEAQPVSLHNYIASSRAQRDTFRAYGPENVGRIQTMRLVGSSLLKELAYRAATHGGFQRALVARRSCSLEGQTRREVEDTIREILATQLPGNTLRPGLSPDFSGNRG